MPPYEQYLRSIYGQFDFLATWLPGQHLALGDVGTLHRGQFTQQTTLAHLGIPFETQQHAGPATLNHQQASSTTFHAHAGADANHVPGLNADASVDIEFQGGGAFRFDAVGITDFSIPNLYAIEQAILNLHQGGRWRNNWIAVTRLYRVAHLTVMVCNSNGGKITLAASGDVAPHGFPLANASVNLGVSRVEGDVTHTISNGPMVPMYKAVRVRSNWWARDAVIPAENTFGGTRPVEVDLEDLLQPTPPSE